MSETQTRILIVDDEKDIAETVEFALQKEGMLSSRAATAGEARKLLGEEEFRLIILDVGLPDENGFDFIKSLRRDSDLPVIFLTARTDEMDRVLGFELGGDDYVQKPFSPRELTARVKAVLKRSLSGKEEPPLFQIEENKLIIRYRGQALQLSRYEYKILKLLIARPGWVYSREKIMDLVWDEPEESFDRTIDTHIKTIRGKLKQIDPDFDPIVTRRGEGYALRETK